MKRKNLEQAVNQTVVSTAVFMESYNKHLPKGFPAAPMKNLEEFYRSHSMLFKNGYKWSIDKHRKRVMDWLSSHHEYNA